MNVKKLQGVTLPEMMLVLAISASILVLGLKMYESFRVDLNAQQVKYNVELLFQGLTNYYRANCISYNKPAKIGTLDPSVSPSDPFPVDTTSLKKAGFLKNWPFPVNPLVDTTAGTNYVTQFNLSTATRSVDMSSGGTQSVGTIYFWRAQVAVALSAAALPNASAYMSMLGADCLSSYDAATNTVTPCATASGNAYLVWERLPSFASPEADANMWPTNPTLDQFTQMYTTYPILTITNGTVANQYYYCGG